MMGEQILRKYVLRAFGMSVEYACSTLWAYALTLWRMVATSARRAASSSSVLHGSAE